MDHWTSDTHLQKLPLNLWKKILSPQTYCRMCLLPFFSKKGKKISHFFLDNDVLGPWGYWGPSCPCPDPQGLPPPHSWSKAPFQPSLGPSPPTSITPEQCQSSVPWLSLPDGVLLRGPSPGSSLSKSVRVVDGARYWPSALPAVPRPCRMLALRGGMASPGVPSVPRSPAQRSSWVSLLPDKARGWILMEVVCFLYT